MQIGCPECKTKTEVVGTFEELEPAKKLWEKLNKELAQSGKKVEYEVFKLPKAGVLSDYNRSLLSE